jgi:8-oxo-dGTP pyrophosphatase MutT (NUDIX family)
VVIVLHVGGSKLADIKLVLQREPSSGKAWFPTGSISSNEEHVDVVVRELYEETCLILTLDDLIMLTMFSNLCTHALISPWRDVMMMRV